MKSNSSQSSAANCGMIVVVDHCDIPLAVEDLGMMDLRIHLDDSREVVPDVQAYWEDESNVHSFHHNGLVDQGVARAASGDNDADEHLGSDHVEHQRFHCNSGDAHVGVGMDQVVVLLSLHAFQDDQRSGYFFLQGVDYTKDESPREHKAFVGEGNDESYFLS